MTNSAKTEDVFLEIGCEELPASFVARACEAMPGLTQKLLGNARLSHGEIQVFGTPRRLAIRVRNVPNRQSDLDEQVLGPPASIGLTATGEFSPAALGFAKKQNLDASALIRIRTEKGDYVGVRRVERGQETEALLPEILRTLCGQIPFQKSMRWGDLDVGFGRPIHWLVALFGARVVPFEFARVQSSAQSYGHRFLAPEALTLSDASNYEKTLRASHVVVQESERRALMLSRLTAAAAKIGGVLQHDAFLLEENASLVEEPSVIAGSFDAQFLELPDEVIVAVMRGHQRYFAVRASADANAPLLPRYLAVVNTALDPETIIRGNDRVLRARLSDARFFVAEDLKRSFSDWQEKLRGVVFQTKLGTVFEKVERIRAQSERLASDNAWNVEQAAHAAALCKADLVALSVGEFPELQGTMGAWYGQRRSESSDVCQAIRGHYAPKSAHDPVPQHKLAQIVGAADRIDTLVGCFGIGLVPSGSADPFALRRAAIAVIRIVKEGGLILNLRATLEAAYESFGTRLDGSSDVKAKVVGALVDFSRTRLRSMLEEEGVPGDICEACLSVWSGDSIADVVQRVYDLQAFAQRSEFSSLKSSVKRAYNISKDYTGARTLSEPLHDGEPSELASDVTLYRAIEQCTQPLRALTTRYEKPLANDPTSEKMHALVAMAAVEKELAEYFANTMVMHENPSIRACRLQLCAALADSVQSFARFDLLRSEAS